MHTLGLHVGTAQDTAAVNAQAVSNENFTAAMTTFFQTPEGRLFLQQQVLAVAVAAANLPVQP